MFAAPSFPLVSGVSRAGDGRRIRRAPRPVGVPVTGPRPQLSWRRLPRCCLLALALSGPPLAAAITTFAPGVALAHDEIKPPVPREQPAAIWPRGAVEAHDVVIPVQLEVAADGTVSTVTVEASIGVDFDAAAVAAARKFLFSPALRAGKPVSARIRSVVRFVGNPALLAQPPAAATPRSAPEQTPPLPQTPSPARTASPPQTPSLAATPGAPAVDVRVEGQSPPRSASEVVRTAENIRAVPRRTGSDALLVVPGVFLTQHSGEGKAHQIFLRGFDAVHGQDVELRVGGAPVNEVSNVHGQGYADLHFVMPETISEVRGQPGTYDPRQGDFAVAGSVSYELGMEAPGFLAKGTLGLFGVKRLFLGYHPASMDSSTFAAAEVYATDGFGPSRAASRASLAAQSTFDVGPVRARALVTAYTGRFDSPGVLRLSDIEEGKVDRFATYDPGQGGTSSRAQVVLDLSSRDGQNRWALAPYFVWRNLRLRSNFTGYLPGSTEKATFQQLNDSVTVGATGHYRRTISLFSPTDALEIGVSARSDWVDQSQSPVSAAVAADPEVANRVDAKVGAVDIGAYADAQLRPFKRLTLRGGFRVDGLSYTSENRLEGQGQARSAMGFRFGGKGTVDVLLAPGLHALASAGQGFRSPQARSLGDGERTPFTGVDSYEVGVRYKTAIFDAYAAGFYTALDQDLVFDHLTGRNEAVPATQRAGFSADIVARPAPYLLATTSVTFTHASFTAADERYDVGDLLPYVPQLVARTEIAFTPTIATFWNRPLTAHVGLGSTLLHERPLPYDEIGHDIFTLDARLSARLKEVEISADFTNLLDARYYDGEFVYASRWTPGTGASLVPIRHVTVGPPFGAFFSLALHLS